MHGKGEFTWSDGRRYVGEYVDDKKNRDMVNFSGQMAENIVDNGMMVNNMEEESI